MHAYNDLIPYIGELFQQIDRKVYLMISKIILPLRASSTKKYFGAKDLAVSRRSEAKNALFAEISKKEKNLGQFLLFKRKTKY